MRLNKKKVDELEEEEIYVLENVTSISKERQVSRSKELRSKEFSIRTSFLIEIIIF